VPAVGTVRPRDSLADLLAAHRAESGLSQEALAAAAGMSVRAVRDLEAGRVRVPQQRSLASLIRVLSPTDEARERFLVAVAEARRDRARVRAGAAPPERDTPRNAVGPLPHPLPAQLPPAPADFTGRTIEVAALHRRLLRGVTSGSPGAGGPVVAVTGEGGLGKTALALRTAHRVRKCFPDGQLHLDLRASRGARPDTAGLLARLLRGLGVPDGAIPRDAGSRAELYRRSTSGRRLLVVLDDVPPAAGIGLLLPEAPTSAVLLTSRHRYDGRPYGAGEVRLGPLGRVAAAELFARLVGPERVVREPEAANAVLDLCAGSPRALREIATWLARRPRWSIAAVLGRPAG